MKNTILLFFGVLLFIQCQKNDDRNLENNLKTDSKVELSSTKDSLYIRGVIEQSKIIAENINKRYKGKDIDVKDIDQYRNMVDRIKKLSAKQYLLLMEMSIDLDTTRFVPLDKRKTRSMSNDEMEEKIREEMKRNQRVLVNNSIDLFGTTPHNLSEDQHMILLNKIEKKIKKY